MKAQGQRSMKQSGAQQQLQAGQRVEGRVLGKEREVSGRGQTDHPGLDAFAFKNSRAFEFYPDIFTKITMAATCKTESRQGEDQKVMDLMWATGGKGLNSGERSRGN